MLAKWVLSVLLMLAASFLYGQGLRFERFTTENGLSQNTILSILQDRNGHIWIGTEDGLNKFNGYSFQVYHDNPVDKASLADDQVWSLTEDGEGRIWIGHAKGISYIQPFSGTIRNFLVEEGTLGFSAYCSRDGRIWFGTTGQGIIEIYKESTIRHKIQVPAPEGVNPKTWELVSNYPLCFLEDGQGRFWVGTRGAGLFLFSAGTFSRVPFQADKTMTIGDVWSIVEDRSGKLYFGTTEGMVTVSPDLQVVEKFSEAQGLSFKRIARLLLSGKTLLIATYGGGLNFFDTYTHEFSQFRHDPADVRSLSSDMAFTLLSDRQDNIWVGTWASGLNLISRNALEFKNHCLRNNIYGLSRHRGKVWTGSYNNGLFVSSYEAGKALDFKPHPLPESVFINGIASGSEFLWLALDGGGIASLSNENVFKKFSRQPGNPSTLHNNIINALVEANGFLWASTRGSGLARMDLEKTYGSKGSVFHFINSSDRSSISHNETSALAFDSTSGSIWAATRKGLCKRTADADTISNFSCYDFPGIASLYFSRENQLWVGTNHGLFRFNDGQFSPVNELGNLNISSIEETDNSTMVISTTVGIYLLKDGSITFYNGRDGLPTDEFNARTGLKLGDGRIVMGSTSGVTAFSPAELSSTGVSPRAVIQGIRFLNRDYEALDGSMKSQIEWDSSGQQVKLTLGKDINVFEVSFFSDDFSDPGSSVYSYKLEGFDDSWNLSAPGIHSTTYTNLDAGKYTFIVSACNTPTQCGSPAALMDVIILPPWWRTWWAYTGYAMLVAGGTILTRKNIVNRERLKARLKLEHFELEKLKELDDFKSKFFANISHELRTPLTLILGQAEELERNSKAPAEVLQSIRKSGKGLLNLVNQMLDLSRVDAGKLDLKVESQGIVEFLAIHASAFQSLASQKGITFQKIFPRMEVRASFDASIVEKIINNLLSNAVKYTDNGGKVTFSAVVIDRKLRLEVTDTGHGISAEHLPRIFDRFYRASENSEGTGIGLSLTQELVRIHGGSIDVKSDPAKGSTFVVEIPVEIVSSEATEGVVSTTTPPANLIFANTTNEGDISNLPLLLVVEDNSELRNFLKRRLTEHYNVQDAASAEEGLKRASEAVPDIIISDWMMPGMSGVDFCEKLKTTEATSHIPVIMLTAKADTDSKVEGLQAGADDYLTKPFEMSELMARLSNLVRQRELLREKFAREGFIHFKQVKVSSMDETFLKKFQSTLEGNHGDSSLSVEVIARKMGVGRVQLHRKLSALTGYAPSDLLRDFRLHRAADLLKQNAGNVSEIAFRVGFENLSYFTKVFREKFGTTPSAFSSNTP